MGLEHNQMESLFKGKHRTYRLLSPNAMLFGPRLAQLVITRKCNLRCKYCNEFDHSSQPVPKEEVYRRVDKLASLGTLFMEYTGGEPLLHPDLIDLVRYASRCRFFERWIITNGYLLTPRNIEQLNDAGLTHLQLSIDGLHPNETSIKMFYPLKKKLQHLQRHARFKVQINAVLGATNPAETIELVRHIQEMGFIPRVSVLHDGKGAFKLDPQGQAGLQKLYEVLGHRWSESGDYRTRLINTGIADFKCRAGARYLYIDERGIVHWCSQQRGVFSKPLDDYTWKDLRGQFRKRKTCSSTCTVSCVRTASRFDEWRRQSGPGQDR